MWLQVPSGDKGSGTDLDSEVAERLLPRNEEGSGAIQEVQHFTEEQCGINDITVKLYFLTVTCTKM